VVVRNAVEIRPSSTVEMAIGNLAWMSGFSAGLHSAHDSGHHSAAISAHNSLYTACSISDPLSVRNHLSLFAVDPAAQPA